MKLSILIFVTMLFLPVCVMAEIPFPDPGHEGLGVRSLGTLGGFEISLWVQGRVMYNYSNIPGPGGTTYATTTNYDFFRQRFRIGVDIKPAENVGVYTQLEYRGGWGGASPEQSDPRASAPVINPFNRLQSRGLRYAFVYANLHDAFNLATGILPLTDQVGRTLFDADWDFNAGGVVFSGRIVKGEYRLGYVRLIEGVGGGLPQIGKDGHLVLADYNLSIIESIKLGGHVYYLNVPQVLVIMSSESQTWYGFTAQGDISELALNGMMLLNRGIINNQSHTGYAIKLEASILMWNNIRLSAQGLTSTGDDAGQVDKRFTTLHQLLGTEGYWGYTHIFTAGGPSDVNDLGLEIGNNSAGLNTIQAKLDFPLVDWLNGQLFGGWFQSNKSRNGSQNMGGEFGGMLICDLAENLSWEFGGAFATIGNFYAASADDLYEIFSRIQLTW